MPADLSSIGGPVAGQLVVGVVQEIDIPSGKVLFQWRSDDHVPLTETNMPQVTAAGNVDYFHLNSVGVDLDGDLLISARHTDAIYKVDRKSGQIKWRLGGKSSDFKLGPGATFHYQHDVRRHADGTLTIFDNGAAVPGAPGVEPFSRPLRLALNMKTMTASLVGQYLPPQGRSTWAMGNVQQLPGGGAFVGWGTFGAFTEFTAAGTVCFDASFGDGSVTYRAFRFPWVGRPTGRPAIAARTWRFHDERLRELERGDRDRLLARRRRSGCDVAEAGADGSAQRLRDRDPHRRRQVVRLRHRARRLGQGARHLPGDPAEL